LDTGSDPNVSQFAAGDDRYPDVKDALTRVAAEGILPDGPCDRVVVEVLASGEITYSFRLPRAEEMEGGYLPEDLG
jgi:hypothetical protein